MDGLHIAAPTLIDRRCFNCGKFSFKARTEPGWAFCKKRNDWFSRQRERKVGMLQLDCWEY